MGPHWGVPRSAYLLPRWIVWLGIGTLLGNAVGSAFAAVVYNSQLFWLSASAAVLFGFFCAGAWRRLRQPASGEFTVSFWGRR